MDESMGSVARAAMETFTTFTTITHGCPFACSPLSVLMAASLVHSSALSETRDALVSRIPELVYYYTGMLYIYYISSRRSMVPQCPPGGRTTSVLFNPAARHRLHT